MPLSFTFKEKLKQRKPLIGTLQTLDSPEITEILVCNLKSRRLVNRTPCIIVNALMTRLIPTTCIISLSCGSLKKLLITPAERNRII